MTRQNRYGGQFTRPAGRSDDSKFRTKRGWLTAYSFACGYIEVEHLGGLQVKLDQPSSMPLYLVTWWDNEQGKWQGASEHHLITLARKAYQRRVDEMAVVKFAYAMGIDYEPAS